MLEAIPFEGSMQRHQHLAREMARYVPVVYVESTPSRLRRLLDGRLLDPALRAHKRGLRDAGGNLKLFKSPPCVPRTSGYRRSADGTSRRTAQALIPLLPPDRPLILWLFSPTAVGALGLYDEMLSVFDCFDAFGEFPGEERFRDEVKAAMLEAAERADLVLATSEELRARLDKANPNTVIVQNGCEPDHFATGGKEPVSGASILDMSALPRPIIGYMGDIAPWVDLELVAHVARRHRDWSIVLLGPWKQELGIVKREPNVYAPGSVPYEELPCYARQFDIGTIPFALTELTRVVNPLKLYEYFAMGIPVVSTALPEATRHEDLVYIASTPDEFVSLLEVALKESRGAPSRSRRVALARQNSWRGRGEVIRGLLEDLLRKREAGERQG
jgi:glycosyltransferase involved in cell wall biosynthesis